MRNYYVQMCDYGSRFRILKGGKISLVVSAFLASTTLSFASPSGGVVTSGTASIAQSGLVTNINQSSQKTSINWQNFSIGANETVNFNQPNVSAITLNRVIGNEKSIIDGALNANGQVWILNSNGILFNSSAKINTSALFATTKALSDEDFQNGNYSFKGESTASIINLGEIEIKNGGYASLLANTVQNEGSIKAIKGTVTLTGASEATINLNGNSLVSLKVDKGVLDALVENKGAILADGGKVYLTTNAVNELLKGVVNNTGLIEANGIDDISGEVILFAHGGTANISGTIEASGGFVETSGNILHVKSDVSIKAKEWLLDPMDITITNGGVDGIGGSSIDADTITAQLNAGTSVTLDATQDISINESIITGDMANDTTLTFKAGRHITMASDTTIDATQNLNDNKLNVHFWADSDNSGDGINIITGTDIKTKGGYVKFGNDATATINGVSTLVGGDVYFNGGVAQSILTDGGAFTLSGESILANINGLTINTNGGNVQFKGLVNSGNSYLGETYIGKTWSEALANAQSGAGGDTGSTYLATITSRLENAIAGKSVNYQQSWLGGRRVTGIGTDSLWRWVSGPEGLMDGNKGLGFFTQASGGGGSASNGGYINWSNNEPNNYYGGSAGTNHTQEYESILQFTGSIGQWNDLTGGPSYDINTPQTLNYYVKETNLASSPLTINAGAGSVTFGGAVGNTKALKSLDVTATTTAINGGAVTTEGEQTYTSNITLGSASTTLTQTNANTDFTIQSNKSITNAYGNDASLTIKTTRNILMDTGSSVSSGTGKLNTIFWADSDANSDGYIFIHDGNTINTNGGDIVLAGGADDGASGQSANDGRPDGFAISATNNISGVSIGRLNNAATSGTTIQSGGGNIFIKGKSTAGAGEGMGINYSHSGTLNAGSGSLSMLGEATNYNGIELSAWAGGMLTISAGTIDISGKTDAACCYGLQTSEQSGWYTTLNAGVGGVRLYGENTSNSQGLVVGANVNTTNGGNILIESPDTFWFYNTHSYNAGSGNITMRVNGLKDTGGITSFTSTGTLTVKPYTAGTTIGIGGATGTLALSSSYFNTNFVDGFANIIIGDASAGDITVGGDVNYRDPLTLKTAGNIITSAGVDFTGAVAGGDGIKSHLILWSDADANNNGYIFIYDGNTINTNGGDIVLAGGADDGSSGQSTNDGRPDGFATATATYSGVSIGRLNNTATAATTIQSGGGNIFIKGKSTAGAGTGMGINYSHSGTLDAGTGTLTMIGESSSYAGIELSAWLDGAATNSYLDISANTINISGTSSNTNYHGLASSQLSNEYTRLSAGAGGISLYGNNTVNTAKGVEISLNATTTNGGGISVESPNYVAIYAGANAHSFNANSGNTILKTNILSIGNNHTLFGTGTLTIKPYTDSRAILLGGIDATKLAFASTYFSTNFADGFSDIIIGSSTQSGAISVGAIAPKDKLTLYSTGGATQSGAITGNQALELLGTGATYTLTNTSNDIASLTSNIGALSYIDSNALSLGMITSSGAIDIATLTGDLTLTANIATSSTAINAITLNAGQSENAAIATGGNIIHTSGSITTGVNGRATLYTGSMSGSTGVSTLVGSGSGHFRYNSDEASTNYTEALSAGMYAIYREQPILTVAPSTTSSTYGSAVSVAGVTGVITGYINGDSTSTTTGTASFTTTATSSSNTGTYDIAYASGLSNSLGYVIVDKTSTTNEYTINKAHLTVTANDASKTYGDANPTLSTTLSGFVLGQTLADSGVTGAGSATTTATTASDAGTPVAITASAGTLSATNYDFTNLVDGTLTINKAHLTVTANDASKTYGDANPTLSTTLSGFVLGQTLADSGVTGAGSATTTATTASDAGTPVAITASAGTLSATNYDFTNLVDGTLTINKAHLTVTANDVSKTYDGLVYAGGNGVSYSGFVNGETSTVLGGTLSYGGSSQGAINIGTYAISLSGYSSSNYQLDYHDGLLTINAMTQQPDVTAIINGTAINPPVITTFTPLTPPSPAPQPFSLGGQQVQLVGMPIADTPTQLVSMQEVRSMMGGSVGDVRIPLGQNSLIQLINGGVRLPNGIEQEFFMAQR